jgi:hypothetical protein
MQLGELSSYSDGMGAQVSIPGTGKRFFLLQSVLTGSEAHPVSCPMGTGALSPEVKRQGRKAHIHLHLVLRSRMVEQYLHCHIHLQVVVFN